MDKQMSLSAFSDELSQVRTKKKEFLTQIERLIPWGSGQHSSNRAIIKESAGTSPSVWS